jgi:hypothetical protein
VSELVVFGVIGTIIWVVSSVLQSLSGQSDPQKRRLAADQRPRTQQTAANQGRRRPVANPPRINVQRAAAQPVQARNVRVARPSSAASAHHLQSQIEDDRDLSDLGERHLAHLQQAAPQPEYLPAQGRSLSNRRVGGQDGSHDEHIKVEDIGTHLSPLQRAFLLSEILSRKPAFEDPKLY